jgi:hypothetical protein
MIGEQECITITTGDGQIVKGQILTSLSDIFNELNKGNNVARYEWGDSMMPLLQSGEYCILIPSNKTTIEVGDAVFCEVNGYIMTHMVMMISRIQDKPMYLIGSPNYNEITNQFTIYGWTSNVFAKAIGTKIIHPKIEE